MIRSFTDSPVHEPTAAFGSAAAPPIQTLEGLARSQASDSATGAVIEGVDGDAAQRRRLLEAGFTAGCPVRFVMATPFGDPLVFSLRGASIALRKSEARCVRVRLAAVS